jgi:aromatic ring hydroxylase
MSARIFRTAWDFAGSALGGRVELYERFYLSSRQRNLALDHLVAQSTGSWGQLDEFLRECDAAS